MLEFMRHHNKKVISLLKRAKKKKRETKLQKKQGSEEKAVHKHNFDNVEIPRKTAQNTQAMEPLKNQTAPVAATVPTQNGQMAQEHQHFNGNGYYQNQMNGYGNYQNSNMMSNGVYNAPNFGYAQNYMPQQFQAYPHNNFQPVKPANNMNGEMYFYDQQQYDDPAFMDARKAKN
jgi:hypothetical protein